MSNTVYNKITVNNDTLIDLSQDTVTSAAHIVSGHVGHLADGTQVTGTYTGALVVTLSYNSTNEQWEPDKTFAQIQAAYNAGTVIAVKTDGLSDTISADGEYVGGVFKYSIRWYDNGIITEQLYDIDSTGLFLNNTYTYIDSSTAISAEPLSVTANGTYTAPSGTAYTPVTVNVPSGQPSLQAKTNISPTTSSQTITADAGYDGLSSVQINAMPTGTAGTPTATKGSVSNHSVSVTPSVTNTTGYITGSTKTGTAVTVSASELVSGSETKTANGTYDVTNLASLVVNVPTASSKAIYTYKGLASRTANSYGSTSASVTVAKAGTYTISYVAVRGSSSGTMGTNLHIGSTSGTNNTTWTGTYAQSVTLTGQTIAANTAVTIYATSGSNSRTIYVGQLIVEEE